MPKYSDAKSFSLEDTVLCQRAAEGDGKAEEQLVLRYHWLVRSCARPLFLMGADHEDLIQEGMVGLIQAIRDFDAGQGVPFSSYAELCIRRRMVSAIRIAAGKRHAVLNDSLSLEADSGEHVSYEDDPETRLIDQEAFQERLNRCRFTGLEQQVLPLYLSGVTRGELSIQLGKSLKSIDNAIGRIRKKLRADG